MKKKIPSFKSDAAAERFVRDSDLTQYDLSGLTPMQFEFEKKGAQLNMRLPKPLLDAVKLRAKKRGIPYTRLVREALERAIATPRSADGR
jgi:predicted DNA binding CopG/RHH family protein